MGIVRKPREAEGPTSEGVSGEDFLMTVIQEILDGLDKTANAPPGKSGLGVWGVMKAAQKKLAKAGYEVVIHGED